MERGRPNSLLLSWKGEVMRAHSKAVMVKVKKRDRCIARSEVESVWRCDVLNIECKRSGSTKIVWGVLFSFRLTRKFWVILGNKHEELYFPCSRAGGCHADNIEGNPRERKKTLSERERNDEWVSRIEHNPIIPLFKHELLQIRHKLESSKILMVWKGYRGPSKIW